MNVVRNNRARRYIIRLGSNGEVRLTIPRRGSVEGGLRFAERQTEWIARERARMAERVTTWTLETELWFRGGRVRVAALLGLDELRARDEELAHADLFARADLADFEAQLRGADLRAECEAHMRRIATAELPPRTHAFAHQHHVDVSKVLVRNQRSRWGACSSRGTITLNWRLVQLPPAVCDYVILHELMHRRQANHSVRFWREVESVCPEWRDAERWIKRHGRGIL